jgi:hypothetical protein
MKFDEQARETAASPLRVDGVDANKQSGSSPPKSANDDRDGRDDVQSRNASTVLLQALEKHRPDFFTDPNGTAYVRLDVEGARQLHAVRSEHLKQLLAKLFWMTQKATISEEQLARVTNNLEARARFEGGESRDVFVRVAMHGGDVYVDLGDPSWRSVRITRDGWSVVTEVPVMFRRPNGFGALPFPERGGSLRELRTMLNLTDEDQFHLIVGFLIGALNPTGSYPILELTGEQGSAKSTTARMLKQLIDPGVAVSRTTPRNEHDLAVAANGSWMLVFDNLSHLGEQMSDAFCRMSTGGSFTTRRLYTDDAEQVFSYQRPVIVNGINGVALRADLLERTLSVELAPIPASARKTEGELTKEFESMRPRLQGALYDAVASALAHKDSLPRYDLPRLADFAEWVTAAEPALGWTPGTFLAAMSANKLRSTERALDEYEGLVPALTALTSSSSSQASHGEWRGTATELLALLAEDKPDWLPRNPNQLTRILRRLQAPLRDAGLQVAFDRGAAARLITLRCRPAATLPEAA